MKADSNSIPLILCIFRPVSPRGIGRTNGHVLARRHAERMENPFLDRICRGDIGRLPFAKARKTQLSQHYAQKIVERSAATSRSKDRCSFARHGIYVRRTACGEAHVARLCCPDGQTPPFAARTRNREGSLPNSDRPSWKSAQC